jgi:hypothetical protein
LRHRLRGPLALTEELPPTLQRARDIDVEVGMP